MGVITEPMEVVTQPVGVAPKRCLVTGSTSGIGQATVMGLAALGFDVIMVCRDERRGARVREAVFAKHPDAIIDVRICDLSSLRQIRVVAAEILRDYDHLDVLLNNAAIVPRRRAESADGYELQFAVNHLAYFLMTKLLLDLLKTSAPSRIINVASTAHSRGHIDFDDLQSRRSYQPYAVYAKTKLCNVLFTYELARRLEGTEVTVNCLHPGVIRTGIFRAVPAPLRWLIGLFMKNPEQGAATPLYLATSPEVASISGKYWRDCKPMGTNELSYDVGVAQRLWDVSEELVG